MFIASGADNNNGCVRRRKRWRRSAVFWGFKHDDENTKKYNARTSFDEQREEEFAITIRPEKKITVKSRSIENEFIARQSVKHVLILYVFSHTYYSVSLTGAVLTFFCCCCWFFGYMTESSIVLEPILKKVQLRTYFSHQRNRPRCSIDSHVPVIVFLVHMTGWRHRTRSRSTPHRHFCPHLCHPKQFERYSSTILRKQLRAVFNPIFKKTATSEQALRKAWLENDKVIGTGCAELVGRLPIGQWWNL